jgi:adenosylcobinamide-GDP ribazoletransferase
MNLFTQFLREYLIAVQFFTRIPITGRLAGWVGFSPDLLRASAAHFPGVGVLIGAIAAISYAVMAALLPESSFTPLAAAALSTVVTVLATGGFHEDGLADAADGLGGSYDKAHALEIMKDSRVGAYGAMALVLALLCKVALLAILGSVEGLPGGWDETPFNGWYVCAALFAGHVISRGMPLLLIYLLPHVGDTATSKSKPLAEQIAPAGLLLALAWCVAALLVAGALIDLTNLLVACSFSIAALLWMGRLFRRRLEGFTGDCLGATQQVCEIAFYFGLAVSI